MRLGQLSRKLEVTPDKIVKVLADNFREVNNHPNIKITEEELAFLVVHFSPAIEKEEIIEEKEMVSETTETPAEESNTEVSAAVAESVPAKEVPEFIEELRPQVITLQEEFNAKKENLEAYKAEKVELEGLKVVGKIELPEPPVKKEKPKEEEKEESDEIKHLNRRPQRNGRRNSNRKPRPSPIEYQRQKEERLAKKQKEQEEKRKKELKKKHYETQVKSKLQQQARKKKKKPVEATPTVALPQSAAPTQN